MSSRSEGSAEVVSAPPVFFLSEETPDDVTHVDICQSAERLVGFGAIVGAQRLGGLWRLYPTTREIRAKLLTGKLLLGGRSIPLRSQNPFSVRNRDGVEVPSTRLTIDGLPVSVASSDLEGYLRKAGASLRSPLLWEKARDRDGKLTRWVTGRRFAWIDLPATPLPQRVQVGSFFARLFYREQPRPVLCFVCGKEGHKRGDPQCREKEPAPSYGAPFEDTGARSESEDDHQIEESGASEAEDSSEGNVEMSREDEESAEEEEEKTREATKTLEGETMRKGSSEMEDEEQRESVEEVKDDKSEKIQGGGENGEKRSSKVIEMSQVEAGARGRGKKKGLGKQRKSSEEANTRPNKGEREGTSKGDRGQSVQLTLSEIFPRSERLSSLKRTEPTSPGEKGLEPQRPRR